MQATVVVFPGSNADAEMVHTLRDVVQLATRTAWHADAELPAGTDLVAIPGGFSYGDYLRSGALAKTSAILGAIRRHAERGGYVLGVCNGFQILTEVGLLPGALTRNAHLRFECRDVHVAPAADGPFTNKLPPVLRLPIAHADGRYHADAAIHATLEREGAVGLRYVAPDGSRSGDANPNGSLGDIAGVYGGVRKNVFGLMPHPERMSEAVLGGSDGRLLFDAVVRSAAERGSS